MKRVFKKNQIIITALALMIAVAGYVSYTQSVGSKEKTDAAAASEAQTSDIGEGNLSEDVFTDTEDNSQDGADASAQTTADATQNEQDDQTEQNPGETVLANSDNGTVDKASEMKLAREQTRSKNKETLLEVVNNNAVTEAQKKEAISKMIEMTDVAEKENAAEMLLKAKGFSDVVVSVVDGEADVVLDMGDVTEAKRAQVEDIVKRKTGVSADKIVITPITK